MDEVQMTEPPARPRWNIDRRLQSLVGRDVRVAAECFAPVRWNGEVLPHFVPVRDLILPDQSQPRGLPVFFEGCLRQFERRIAVVYVGLEACRTTERPAEGILAFRGRAAVILHGPATVVLAFPFRVEPLPSEAYNYWEDLRLPTAQFRLSFDSGNKPVL